MLSAFALTTVTLSMVTLSMVTLSMVTLSIVILSSAILSAVSLSTIHPLAVVDVVSDITWCMFAAWCVHLQTTMAEDLVQRKRLASVVEGLSMPRIDFAQLLLDEYIRYPYSAEAVVPFNFCAIGSAVPRLKHFFSHFCK